MWIGGAAPSLHCMQTTNQNLELHELRNCGLELSSYQQTKAGTIGKVAVLQEFRDTAPSLMTNFSNSSLLAMRAYY